MSMSPLSCCQSCRNFISLLRGKPLKDTITFDKALTFHKVTTWAIVGFTVVHILAHVVNLYMCGMTDASATTTRLRFLAFLSLNFPTSTGTGIMSWIMTTCLGFILLFSNAALYDQT